MLCRNLTIPFKLWCVTDNPIDIRSEIGIIPIWNELDDLGGCYKRIKALSKEFIEMMGYRFLSLDLDCVIVDDITKLVNRDEPFIIWESNRKRKTPYCGSMWMINGLEYSWVWEKFRKNPPLEALYAKQSKYNTGTDQSYFSYLLYPELATWTTDDGVYNFKTHVEPRCPTRNTLLPGKKTTMYPKNSKIIFFNGKFDPTIRRLQQRFPWIKEYYK